jgi:hypothetical protein
MLALIRNAHTIDKDQSGVPRLTALAPQPQVTTKAVHLSFRHAHLCCALP